MTYRDDHDAALARAESLEAELAKVERERDRLRAELEQAKHAEPQPAPPQPVHVAHRSLSDDELTRLLDALADGARGARSDPGMILVIAMVCAMFAVFGIFAHSVKMSVGGFGFAALLALSALFSASNREDDWQPVLAALRDHPDRITTIRESTGKYGEVLVIATYEHEMRVSTTESASLLALLARRCPRARFENSR